MSDLRNALDRQLTDQAVLGHDRKTAASGRARFAAKASRIEFTVGTGIMFTIGTGARSPR